MIVTDLDSKALYLLHNDTIVVLKNKDIDEHY